MQKVPLKRLCKIVSGSGFPNSYQGVSNESIPFYKVGSLSQTDSESYLHKAENTISNATAEVLGATIIPPHSCLMAKIGAAVLLKRVAMNAQEACIDNNMMALVPQSNVHPKYLFYLLQTIQLEPLMNPGAVPNLNMEFFRNSLVPYVPWEEQRRIADELDRELAEIDEFVADQQRLLELATEKFNSELRQLTHPIDAPTVPLKRFAQITLGKMITPSDKGDMQLAPYIRAANVQPGGVFTYQTDKKEMWFSPTELSYLNLKKDDVLVVEGGAGFGRSAVLTDDLPGWGFQNSINRVRVNKELADPNFISFCLRAQLLFGDLNNLTNQSTIPHLTAEKLAVVEIPYINLESQLMASKNLLKQQNILEQIQEDIQNSILLLNEQKTSKINLGNNK